MPISSASLAQERRELLRALEHMLRAQVAKAWNQWKLAVEGTAQEKAASRGLKHFLHAQLSKAWNTWVQNVFEEMMRMKALRMAVAR